MNLMSLGMFVFSLPTLAYQELQHSRSWRHARSGRFGATDAVQFTGRDNDEITLSGDAPAELMAGRASLDQLVEMAGDGDPYPLTDGAGRVYGNFVITKIDERHRELFPDGTPRLIAFTLSLLEVEDGTAAAKS